MVNNKKAIILGSGIAGLSAGYHLLKNGQSAVLYEKDSTIGGLCGAFVVDGFRFDKFVHFSFTEKQNVKDILYKNIPTIEHKPVSNNYYKGIWLKHPAQNNLLPLNLREKLEIIAGFWKRKKQDFSKIENYEQWLRCQYGDYFAENFPMEYTKKYWGVEAKELETNWVGKRMYCPDLMQVLYGAFFESDKNYYYAKSMFYPEKGGFQSFLSNITEGLDIKCNKEAIKIDVENKEVHFSDGTFEAYDTLFSSIPLPEIVKLIQDVPCEIEKASRALSFTSGYMVSIGVKKPNVAKDLWFYVYDEDIPFARVYSPSMKSLDNVPNGCSSFQAEIFWENNKKNPSEKEMLQKTIECFSKMKILNIDDIITKDIRFEKYANIVFKRDIYEKRKLILSYLREKNIVSIGRFGKWDYFWSDQAFEDGRESVEQYVSKK